MHDCCSTTGMTIDVKDNSQQTGMLAVGGSVLSAFAASACCWIPILLIAFGVSFGGVSAWFEQYRWLFLGLTAILLGTGFYFVYFRKSRYAPGAACAEPDRRLQRFNRVMLWVATAVVIATAAFPKYVGYLIPKSPAAQAAGPVGELTTVSLGIDGMTCEACAVHVRNALVSGRAASALLCRLDRASAGRRGTVSGQSRMPRPKSRDGQHLRRFGPRGA